MQYISCLLAYPSILFQYLAYSSAKNELQKIQFICDMKYPAIPG